MTDDARDTEIVDRITKIALGRHTRRGMFGTLGKAGLALAGLACGLGLPRATFACISPPPQCYGPCSCCYSSCYLPNCGNRYCSCPSCKCFSKQFQIFQYFGSGCSCFIDCVECANGLAC